tara:strand:+ start:6 stop:188 length:183 start_codon:yes stop_codon:yes gene_type:complete
MKYTKEQYKLFIETMNDDDWKRIRVNMEKKIPKIKKWDEELFRAYSTRVVTSEFRKEGLN